jgi:hypothetical protein
MGAHSAPEGGKAKPVKVNRQQKPVKAKAATTPELASRLRIPRWLGGKP